MFAPIPRSVSTSPLARRGNGSQRLFAVALVVVMLTAGLARTPFGLESATAQLSLRAPSPPTANFGESGDRFVRVDARRLGASSTGVWLFSPRAPIVAPAGATAEPLPVVLFLHGLNALDPSVYREWIDHLVRRGHYVVYPDYHPTNPLAEPWETFLPNLLESVRGVRAEMSEETNVRPDWSKLLVVGHSLGGVMAVAYAAVAPGTAGMPVPAAVMVVQPGGCRGCGGLTDEGGVPVPDLAGIDPTSRILVVAAEEDVVVGERAARLIWTGLGEIPLDNRGYVLLRSDRRGDPALIADHLLAQTAGPGSTADALDWFGLWALFDSLTACALVGVDCVETVAAGDVAWGLGQWSDGVPVTPALIGDDPAALNGSDTANLADG